MTASQSGGTADPLARTVLSWQRTLLVLAVTGVTLAFGVAAAGIPWLAPTMLVLTLVPVPASVRRGRALLHPGPHPVDVWIAGTLSVVVVTMAVVALLVALG